MSPPELATKPLPTGLQRVGDRIVEFFDSGGDPPYQLYIYDPSDEWAVRREFNDLRHWLQAPPRRIACAAISLASLFWAALEEQGWLDALVEQEREANGDPAALAEIHTAVGEALRQSPDLPKRVLDELDNIDEGLDNADRAAVVLYRAGALFPAYRTSTLLEDLLGRINRPVTLLYPGTLAGEGLRFMGICEPTYGYRALKVPRGDGK